MPHYRQSWDVGCNISIGPPTLQQIPGFDLPRPLLPALAVVWDEERAWGKMPPSRDGDLTAILKLSVCSTPSTLIQSLCPKEVMQEDGPGIDF